MFDIEFDPSVSVTIEGVCIHKESWDGGNRDRGNVVWG